MAFLNIFSQEERNLIVSLPYKAGLWVSTCDTAGGQFADTEELIALEDMIRKMTRGMFESAFVHEVMAECVTRKAEWPEWAKGKDDSLVQSQNVIRLLQSKGLTNRDIDAYRRLVMQLGLEVARAFREYDKNEPFHFQLIRCIGIGVDRLFGAMKGEKSTSEDLLNVSYKEDVALNKLASALRGEAHQHEIITNS